MDCSTSIAISASLIVWDPETARKRWGCTQNEFGYLDSSVIGLPFAPIRVEKPSSSPAWRNCSNVGIVSSEWPQTSSGTEIEEETPIRAICLKGAVDRQPRTPKSFFSAAKQLWTKR
jgi:hypothetical protein